MPALNAWTARLHAVADHALARYGAGARGADSFFAAEDVAFLASIGLRPIHVYDFAEDFTGSGEPDWDTFLLIAAARRDYFLYEMNGAPPARIVREPDLPVRQAELGGIPWLPRILVKAQAFLEGALEDPIMYCCGGDRHFLRTHGIHPADFLRAVWAARGDEQKVLAFVRRGTRS